VPEGRWSLRETLSTEMTRDPSTALAAQRITWSFGVFCCVPSCPNILASHSLNADALTAHVRLYRTIMYGESRLWRSEREAIAVCVSAANGWHY
jgi:hypothetical protein